MKKLVALWSLCILFPALQAQRSYESESPRHLLNEGKELFEERNYAGTIDKLNYFLQNHVDTNDREEADYLLAASTYYMGSKDAMQMVREYLDNHPAGRFTNEASFLLGSLFFEQKDYKKAIFWMNEADIDILSAKQQDEYCFRVAYSNLELKKYDEADFYFSLLEKNSDSYRSTAEYYLAYIQYAQGNYNKALKAFTKLKADPAFRKNALYFTTQIYFVQGKYARTIEEGQQLLKSYPDNSENTEIKRLLGNSYYQEGNLQQAIDYLSQYAQEAEKPQRNDLYILGICYFTTHQYNKAVKYLSKTVAKNDEIGQNAYLYLGQAYLKLDDKYNARMAFEAASQSTFDRSVQEAALFNYALLIHETFSAFGENVKVFEDFLNRFPNSRYADQVSKYLVEVYLTTKNYEAALQSIEKIKSPGPKILEAKQSILYQLGINAFANSDYNDAINFFTKAIQVGSYNPIAKANALFWRGESYAKLNKYDLAKKDYQSYLSSANKNNTLTKMAYYGLGYAYFKQKNYNEALRQFDSYLSRETQDSNPAFADAFNRKGDCLFYTRDFTGAKEAYAQADRLLPSIGDYSLYQLAIIEGIIKNYPEKINKLNTLINMYPESSYMDDALFEKGRTYVITENSGEAEKAFIRLMEKCPNSVLARKAGIQLGLLYFNENRLDNAIQVLKSIIKSYPGSEEAQIALQDLKTIYVEKDAVDSYVDYTNTLGGSSRLEEREQDSLSYIAAEKLYMRGQYEVALKSFQNYLNRFNPGIFTVSAQFYSGKINYNNKNYDKALNDLKAVLASENLTFREEALTMKANIEYLREDYHEAIKSFEELYHTAHESVLKEEALLGMLRSAYYSKLYDKAIEAADKMHSIEKLPAEMRNEASYIKAKALINLNRIKDAVPLLSELKKDTRNTFGAEAKYLLALYYFDTDQKDKAEKEIMSYIEEGTPHSYWLAKSFILLSDIYISQNDNFQAKQYLESVKANYKGEDDILPEVEKRLQKISQQ
ncbi:MAG: tetratricopeptide repeat protein [Bacteroidales bacterium]|nr:tetratricopeptide repeat protein [Bacteroidales bacterium]